MGRQTIFIIAPNPQARNKLFEKFMSQVLGRYGYHLARIKKINHTAMEIEIEGKHEATGSPSSAAQKIRRENTANSNSSATKAQRHKERVWIISLYQKSVMSVASCQLPVAKGEKGG